MPALRLTNSAFLCVAALLLLGSCSSRDEGERAPLSGNGPDIFVVYDSWHAAIVIRKADFAAEVIPETGDFPGAEYLEFSWGDADYFPAADAGIRLALRAAFWSRGSVLHVVGIDRTPRQYFPAAEIIRVPVSMEAFGRLERFLSEQFRRPDSAAPAPAMPGLVSNSRFYPAMGKFSLLRTCNTWVAEALQYAGLPISSGFVITAANLGRRVQPLGTALD
jgi:uncharacterized protein (TIGR02117 family)